MTGTNSELDDARGSQIQTDALHKAPVSKGNPVTFDEPSPEGAEMPSRLRTAVHKLMDVPAKLCRHGKHQYTESMKELISLPLIRFSFAAFTKNIRQRHIDFVWTASHHESISHHFHRNTISLRDLAEPEGLWYFYRIVSA